MTLTVEDWRRIAKDLEIAKGSLDPMRDINLFTAVSLAEEQINYVRGVLERRTVPVEKIPASLGKGFIVADWCEKCENPVGCCTCP